jgi:cytochrome c-type biogenesis protein CcsB
MAMKKITSTLFSPLFMGMVLVIMAVAMAIATFIENDYGSSAARSLVYDRWWFELLFLLAAVNLAGQVYIYRLYKKGKRAVMIFHVAFIIMIAGAAVTRYAGYEGIMHIREGEESSLWLSSDYYITTTVRGDKGEVKESHKSSFGITPVSVDKYRWEYRSGDERRGVTMTRFMPNVAEAYADMPGGVPVVSLVITHGMSSREVVVVAEGDRKVVAGLIVGFEAGEESDITLRRRNDTIWMVSANQVTSVTMTGEDVVVWEPGDYIPLNTMSIYNDGHYRIVAGRISMSASLRPVPVDPARERTGLNVLEFEITRPGETKKVYLRERESDLFSSVTTTFGDENIEITYGPAEKELPFALRLNDFILERYPGSNSPSGYKSIVQLIDRENGVNEEHHIFMNNVLNYRGYRFFQSSYDNDERGTILSVNRDRAGMVITYTGYALLFLFTMLSLFSSKSLFRTIRAGAWSSRLRSAVSLLVLLTLSLTAVAQDSDNKLIADRELADRFGTLLVQDQRGRTKPLHTLSSEIVRKITGRDSYAGYSSMQVFLGLTLDFQNWQHEPMIKHKSRELQTITNLRSDRIAFSDLVILSPQPYYMLNDHVERAYGTPPAQRTRTDKEIVKLDERINISYMLQSGDFLKIFPLNDGTDRWGSPAEAIVTATGKEDSLFLGNVMSLYADAVVSGDKMLASDIITAISAYQRRFATYDLPPEGKVAAEILYNRTNIYRKLFPVYGAVGLMLLIILVYRVLTGRNHGAVLLKIIWVAVLALFLLHSGGVALRWFISGRSPMSNGYESMIFISWVTILAGLIYSRRSWFALAATTTLASMTLMVANLSFMDPEITALVPVLQSHWLTFHVSIITAGYGFFGLSAVLGLISLLLFAVATGKNRMRIAKTADELVVINYQAMTLGLYFMVIGTFIGAIWANESWGRYWGWDPKETWSLITIIVYSFVIHARNMPGMRDIYTYNVMSVLAFGSVIMTYFGVNYYLSGLHSYAGGDPIQLPAALYITIALILLLAVMAYRRYVTFEEKKSP